MMEFRVPLDFIRVRPRKEIRAFTNSEGMRSLSKILERIRNKQVTASLCLVVAVFTALPTPIVSRQKDDTDSKVATERFPCENSPCGCRTAQHCWTKCCCRTPKQRAEWAKSNGVVPPSYANVEYESHAVATQSPACCAKKPNATPDVTPDAPIAKSCCSQRS